MTDEPDSSKLKAGMEASPDGDPRVLFVLNVILSLVYAYIVLYLVELAGITGFTWERYLVVTAVTVGLVHYITR